MIFVVRSSSVINIIDFGCEGSFANLNLGWLEIRVRPFSNSILDIHTVGVMSFIVSVFSSAKFSCHHGNALQIVKKMAA